MPLYPQVESLPALLDFRTASAGLLERDLGWYHWQGGGSWTSGDAAAIGFRLPAQYCHRADAVFDVHPYLAPSRPSLDVSVMVNGTRAAQWRIGGKSGVQEVEVPIVTADARCRVDMLFRFNRPGSPQSPFPTSEDARPLQLEFIKMRIIPPGAIVRQ